MTIEIAITKRELLLVLDALKDSEERSTNARNIFTKQLAAYDDTEEYPLVTMTMRNLMSDNINDIRDLTYYLRAKGDC